MNISLNSLRRGFTMIELLVVIVIIGILGATAVGAYGSFIEKAHKKNAADICEQIKVAWSNYHRDLGFWPDEFNIDSTGVKRMDPDMCLVLGKAQLLDVIYLDKEDKSAAQKALKKSKDKEPELKYGMLSPEGLKLFKRSKGKMNDSTARDLLYHFVLDVNEDGVVDKSDGLPAELGIKKVRGDVAVWCWPQDRDARNAGETFAQSW